MSWGMSAAHLSDEGWTAGASRGNDSRERARATVAVCAMARDAADAALILDVLGLEPSKAKGEQT